MKKNNKSLRCITLILVLLSIILPGCSSDISPELKDYYNKASEKIEGVIDVESVESELDSIKDMVSKEELTVTYMDVGQSDCTVITCGDDTMVIDCAEDDRGTQIQKLLQEKGISSIDYLVLTHPDADHIGSADVIIEKYAVENLYMTEYVADTYAYERMMKVVESKGIEWSQPEVGKSFSLGDAKVLIVGPVGSYEDPNNNSISLLIEHGLNTFLFTGDAEELAEADMVNSGLLKPVDVYKVGHHGSSTSTTQELLDVIKPQSAVISCAMGNDHGHPHGSVLNRLKRESTEVYRTDEQGQITVVSNGITIVFNKEPSTTWEAGAWQTQQ